MNNWQLFHTFRYLAGEGKVRPLTCPDCSQELVTMLGEDEEPVLYCAQENVYITPGLDLIAQVRAVVMEHMEFG